MTKKNKEERAPFVAKTFGFGQEAQSFYVLIILLNQQI